MGALHLVRIDFKAGHRVGFRCLAHQKVTAGLVRVGLMRTLINKDQPGKDGTTSVVERILIEEVRVAPLAGMMPQAGSQENALTNSR